MMPQCRKSLHALTGLSVLVVMAVAVIAAEAQEPAPVAGRPAAYAHAGSYRHAPLIIGAIGLFRHLRSSTARQGAGDTGTVSPES